jgi:hypothetical protein
MARGVLPVVMDFRQLQRFDNHGKNVLIKRMVHEIVEISCFMQTIGVTI